MHRKRDLENLWKPSQFFWRFPIDSHFSIEKSIQCRPKEWLTFNYSLVIEDAFCNIYLLKPESLLSISAQSSEKPKKKNSPKANNRMEKDLKYLPCISWLKERSWESIRWSLRRWNGKEGGYGERENEKEEKGGKELGQWIKKWMNQDLDKIGGDLEVSQMETGSKGPQSKKLIISIPPFSPTRVNGQEG